MILVLVRERKMQRVHLWYQIYLLKIVAQIVCWLRLVSVILNPPQSTNKLSFVESFAKDARLKANDYLSKAIASKTGSLTKQLLSSRPWKENLPERHLWEGTLRSKYESDKGDGKRPIQPSRVPIQVLREITSQLESFGIELLTRDFVQGTITSCSDSIVNAYVEFAEDVSSDVALQLLVDIMFFEIALSATAFSQAKEKFMEKV